MVDSLFIAVIEDGAPKEAKQQIIERGTSIPSSAAHKLANNVLLINCQDINANVLKKLLLPNLDKSDEEDVPAVMIFKLNGTVAGYYYKSAWEWLDEYGPQSESDS